MSSSQSTSQLQNYLRQPYPVLIIDGQGSLQAANQLALQIASQLTKPAYLQTISPEQSKKSISIDQIRALRKQLTLQSQRGETRVILIEDISKLSSEAQNALLKTLEELGKNIFILITASSPQDALKTIRSRSQIITVSGRQPKVSDQKQQLIDQAIVGHKDADNLDQSDLQDASKFIKLSVAERLTEYKSYTADRQKIIQLLQALRALTILMMRSSPTAELKKTWAAKTQTVNQIINSANSSASAKLLLLSASCEL